MSAPPAIGSPATTAASPEQLTGSRRFTAMRWIAIGIQLAFVLVLSMGFGDAIPLGPILSICGLQALSNLPPLWRRVSAVASDPAAMFGQILVDVLALTAIAYFTGGGTNPLISLYLPLIAVAATILPPRHAAAIAAISISCYSLVSLVHAPAHVHDPEQAFRSHLIGMWVIFVCSALTISWFVVRLNAAIRHRDAALAAARESALRNERVVALGSLAAGAAHELGTPLATMAVVVGELAADPSLPHHVKSDVELVQTQVQECKRIITRLAARAGSSRAEAVQPVSADVWIEQLVDRWRRQRPQVVPDVRIEGPIPGPRIAADATLEQALLNLFNNAADASPGQVAIHAGWDAEQVRVQVLDRGRGIPPEISERLGRDLVSTRDDGSGMGVVLALSAVEHSGGTLSITDRADGGTLAKVLLPLASIGAETADGHERSTAGGTEGRWGELLLVDDDPVFAQVLGRALKARGFTVRTAASLDEAGAQLGSDGGFAPDFAILDLNLAGSSGLKLIGALRQASPQCRIVVLTGYASISTAVDAIKLGADQYLAKPIEVDAIVRALTDAQTPDQDDAGDNTLSVSRLEWEHIQRVLAENSGNVSATARALKMHRRTLQRKLTKRPVRE